MRISINGSEPIDILLTESDLNEVCEEIENQVKDIQAFSAFTCSPVGNTIQMASPIAGENSSVRVMPGLKNDVAARLKLGTLFGGTETDAVASKRPVETPDHGILKGEEIT